MNQSAAPARVPARAAQKAVYVELRDVYGTTKLYPYCDNAKAFARIAGTKTLSTDDLRNIKALGFVVLARTEQVEQLNAMLRAA